MTSAALQSIRGHFEKIRPEIEVLFSQQWADPELPGMEYRSAERLKKFLASHGFAVDSAPAGIPTAFIARKLGGTGPVVAILCEYDALPGLANEAVAQRRPLSLAAGHACGHNHIGPTNAAAGILAGKVAADLSLPGEIRVIGCPAEEILWGKIALLKADVFEDVDVVLTSHGDYQTGVLSRPCQSVVMGEFVFLGSAGHGGFKKSFNALTCAEAFVAAVEQESAERFPSVQLRHVLRRAGVTPGITPDEVRVWYSTRHTEFETARVAYAAIVDQAKHASSTRGLQMREQFISESRGYLANDVIGKTLFSVMQDIGNPQWIADDLSFMKELCLAVAPGEAMSLSGEATYFDTGEDYYGQDDGEVSWRVPLGRVNWAYPSQVPIHHWAWTALSGHRASYPGPLQAAQVLAGGALRLLAAPSLIAQAKDELQNRTHGLLVDMPRLGALRTLREDPAAFWNATWTEVLT